MWSQMGTVVGHWPEERGSQRILLPLLRTEGKRRRRRRDAAEHHCYDTPQAVQSHDPGYSLVMPQEEWCDGGAERRVMTISHVHP